MSDALFSFNGQHLSLTPGLTLAALIEQQGLVAASVATAVNAGFVARDQRAFTLLAPGDKVTVFQAIVGG